MMLRVIMMIVWGVLVDVCECGDVCDRMVF